MTDASAGRVLVFGWDGIEREAMGETVGRGAVSSVGAAGLWWVRLAGRDVRGPWAWGRGRVLTVFAVLVAGLLGFPRAVPNSVGRVGSLLEVFLPWLGLAVVVLFGLALLRRSAVALVALLLPVAAWTYHFGGLLLPGAEPGARDLVVVQHNVSDENT
ncbi:hypothetical protein ACWD25_45210, partial [Streptomyces sp. NPDC002920]